MASPFFVIRTRGFNLGSRDFGDAMGGVCTIPGAEGYDVKHGSFWALVNKGTHLGISTANSGLEIPKTNSEEHEEKLSSHDDPNGRGEIIDA